MERIQGLNPTRLLWCCEERHVTPHQLADDVGISTQTLDRALEGEPALTFNQLSRIALYFNRGVLFFLEQGQVDETAIHTPQFRTLENQKPEISTRIKDLIERAEWQRDVFASLREDLPEDDGVSFQPPQIAANDPRAAARITRDWLGLTQQRTFEDFRAAVEGRGVLVFRSNGYAGKWQIPRESPILGFSLYDAQYPVVVVKKQRWETRQTFTLMHELGHILLHRESSIDDESDLYSRDGMEQQANAFAGHLLVPDNFLEQIRDQARPDDVRDYDNWLAPFRRAWGVSGEVILRRLLDSGRISRESYSAYRTWWSENVEFAGDEDSGSRAYRHREPRHIFGDRFVRTVLDAVNARQITLARASNYLDSLKISDIHQLEQHYARA